MSKSEQKRICVQTECSVRDELREQLDARDKEIAELNNNIRIRYNLKEKHEKELGLLREALIDAADDLGLFANDKYDYDNILKYTALAKLEVEGEPKYLETERTNGGLRLRLDK